MGSRSTVEGSFKFLLIINIEKFTQFVALETEKTAMQQQSSENVMEEPRNVKKDCSSYETAFKKQSHAKDGRYVHTGSNVV